MAAPPPSRPGPMPTPHSAMGDAIRAAIAEHNAQPCVNRRHLELLRAAATRIDACDQEETILRGKWITAHKLLQQAMALLGTDVTATAVNTLRTQVDFYTLRNPLT